jgi:uncharacterized protein YbjT (DUF2867 family)
MTHPLPAIAILAATGKVGSQIISKLSRDGIPAKALSRNAASSMDRENIQWVQGDIEESEDLKRFLDGTEKLFLNSGVSGQMVEQQCMIIDIAKRTGIKQIVKLSTPEARSLSKSRTGEWHWKIEEYLRSSGLAWNCLQPQSFMQNWLSTLAPSIRTERKIYSAAGKGKRAFIDTRDIAGVAVKLLTDPGEWINTTIPLSGGTLIGYYDVAGAISMALNEKVSYIAQTPELASERMRGQGMPEFLINVTLLTEGNQAQGLAEKLLTDNVEKITGIAPIPVDQFAIDYADYFR